MDWNTYYTMFDDILEKRITDAPYYNDAYLEYVQMNKARIQRWLKKNPISDELKTIVQAIDTPQKWILITEPWCGDAAHSTPLIYLLSELNDNIELKIVLRDSNNLIDSYLTNGGKSIPKLVVRDHNDNDLFDWGPRPKEAQHLVMSMKNTDLTMHEKHQKTQRWYNVDKGVSMQEELMRLIGVMNASVS